MRAFKIGGGFLALAMVIGILWMVFFMTRIPNGYVGVVYSPSGGVQEDTLGQGWHPIGLFEKVTKYPVRMQTVEYADMKSATSDGKNISMDYAYNYQIQPDKVVPIFNKFGPISVEEIENNYLRTRFWDAARQGVSNFTVIETYGEKSAEVRNSVQENFSADIKDLGFIVQDVTVGVPKPDAKTQEAIDARVQASQELERKETEKQIAIKEAERKKAEAEGIADAEIEKARGIAEANRMIEESLTENVIKYKMIEQLPNIELPKVMGSGQSIIELPDSLINQ